MPRVSWQQLSRHPLTRMWSVCFVLMLFASVLAPAWRLTFFAPFLVKTFYRRPLIFALWAAFGCGLVVDLLSASPRFGIYALNYCLTCLILHRNQRHFYEDNLSTLPIMTLLFGVLSTMVHSFLLDLFAHGPVWSVRWIFTDLIVMPALDALYAGVVFVLPGLLVRSRLPASEEEEFLHDRPR